MIRIKIFFSSLWNIFIYIFSFKKTLIYVGGYPSIPNVGDVALWDGIRALFPGFLIIHFKGGRFEKFFFNLFKKRKPLCVMAGGTLINHMCLREAKDAIETFGEINVFGTGVAQSSYWNGQSGYINQEDDWKKVLTKSRYIGVRGPLSTHQLNLIGLSSEIFGDPVIALALPRELNGIKKFGSPKKVVGVNVGSSLGHVQGGEENLKNIFEKFGKNLTNNGYEIKWFVVCPEDLKISQELADICGGKVIKVYRSYNKYYGELEECFFFVGTKLHAVCLSLCRSIPSIMIEYRPKCRDFMLSLDLGEWSISADQCTEEKLNQLFYDLDLNYSNAVDKLNRNILQIQKHQKEKISKFLKEI